MSAAKNTDANHSVVPKPPSVPGYWRVSVSAADPEAPTAPGTGAPGTGAPGALPGTGATAGLSGSSGQAAQAGLSGLSGLSGQAAQAAQSGQAARSAQSARRFWLVVSLGGVRAYPDDRVTAGKPPCVYVVPESDSPEEAERMDMMPRFKLISADKAVLSGPQRDLTADPGKDEPPYGGGPAFSSTSGADSRDFLEAYPAPVDEPFSSEHFNCYLWSPSRESALVLAPGGGVSWNARADEKTVMNFGTTKSATVWTVRRAAAEA